MTITPELARDILKGNTKNRPLNNTTVVDYACQMEKGLWKLNGEPIIVSTTGGLLDGQHRLEACVLSNTPFQSIVIYNVDDTAFSTIDTGRVRTASDIFSINGITNSHQAASVVSAYFTLKSSQSSFVRNAGIRRIKISKQELLDFYEKNSSLVSLAVSLSAKCIKKMRILTQSQIGAYALYLAIDKKHPFKKVSDFFLELFGFNDVTNKSIETLREALVRCALKQSLITPSTKNIYVIKTWNAYLTNKKITRLSYMKDVEGEIEFV